MLLAEQKEFCATGVRQGGAALVMGVKILMGFEDCGWTFQTPISAKYEAHLRDFSHKIIRYKACVGINEHIISINPHMCENMQVENINRFRAALAVRIINRSSYA